MIDLLVLATASTLMTRGAPEPPICSAADTPGVVACLSAELARAEAELGRYRTAARKQFASPDAAGPTRVASFDEAEGAWVQYRNAQCGAVYEYWREGSIRSTKSVVCSIRLTRQHTHDVWREWLTYVDSTAPILPEPMVSTEP